MTTPLPIRLAAVTVDAFRGWSGRHRLELGPGLTLLVGTNGAGKSSLVNAIEWCLFGAQVARKSSGLDERADWEIANRSAQRGVEVQLELALPEGTATLVRRRPRDAKPRDPDELSLELPGGKQLGGEDVDAWMERSGLPDWQTWKHAFCQHQEQPRTRIIDASERSVQLGRLLGLDAYRETGERLKGLKIRELAARASSELGSIEDELTRALERPDRELRELEERLEQRGVARTEIGEGMFTSCTESLLSEGQRMADALDLDATLPDPSLSSLAEVLRWAHDWPSVLQPRRQRLERERREHASELHELETAFEAVGPAERRRRDARDAWRRWTTEYGTRETLEREGEALRAERERLRAAQREHDEQAQLLRQAVELLEHGDHARECPVCGHESASLLERLRDRLEGDAEGGLAERERELRQRERSLEKQRARLAALESDMEVAQTECERLARRVGARLPVGETMGAGGGGAGGQPADDVEGLRAEWRARLQREQELVDEVDEHLARHRAEVEVLELLARWQAARARADAATGDLTRVEAWSELQEAIDDASRLAVDLEALGQMAREVQELRSDERVREVNRTLGAHYGRITGKPEDEAVCVSVHSTASRLTYQLVDGDGNSITPILNQAAIHALSMAVLFAQAEERAREGSPRWLVLDDPGQSLDERAVDGLARALVELASRVPTLVATYPGPLADALVRPGSSGGADRVLTIETDADGRGIALEEAAG